MPLTAGTLLGPYEILAPLGVGGMGEVFTARDTRLDRSVAVKILRSDLPHDADRRARFEREAKAIAALTHPHICTLYDVGRTRVPGTEEEVAFLVMELLEGETLADRLARGPLRLDEALAYGMQIADALDRAHRQGIVHRDLKPGNIMLTRGGAKLLDFGLARLRADAEAPLEQATRTSPLTGDGLVLGTLQYMAPEQLEGGAVDQRADLFALGAILYEMATGRRAFEAGSAAGVISAILGTQPPPVSSIAPLVPPTLDRVVSTALAKNPDDRWASAHDVRLLLRQAGAERVSGSAPVQTARRREWIAWTAAAAAVAVAAWLVTRDVWRVTPPMDILSIVAPDDATLTRGEAPQISPDGRLIAFVATDAAGRTRLYVRDRGTTTARVLTGTDEATLPFWSPDSRSLGYFATGRLRVVDIAGGTPRALAAAHVPRGGTWNRANQILYVPYPNQPPHVIDAAGGTPVPAPAESPESGRARWFPAFLPDGRHYIYLSTRSDRIGSSIRLASLDNTETSDIVQTNASAMYVPPGYLLYRRDGALVARRLDLDTFTLDGASSTIAASVGFNPITYQTLFSASADGALAYLETSGGWQFVWFDMLGRQLEAVTPAGGYNSLCLSADGKHVVHDVADSKTGAVDVWSLDLESRTPTRLTFDPAVDFLVACSPRTNEAVFSSLRNGLPQLHRVALSTPGGESPLLPVSTPSVATDWSSDGRHVLYSVFTPATGWDIWVLPLDGGKPYALVATSAEERNGRFSPDGRWIAYVSDQGGTLEIYVRPFSGSTVRWQISTGGGRLPLWRPDGRQLFYISPDKKIVAVDVKVGGGNFAAGVSRPIAGTRVGGWEQTNQATPYAISADGTRFLINNAAEGTSPIHLMLNWPRAVR